MLALQDGLSESVRIAVGVPLGDESIGSASFPIDIF